MDAWADFKEKFLVSFVVLSDLVSSDHSDRIVVPDGMSFFRKQTFLGIFIVCEPDVAVVDVRFRRGILPGSFSGEKFNVNNLAELTEVLRNLFFTAVFG